MQAVVCTLSRCVFRLHMSGKLTGRLLSSSQHVKSRQPARALDPTLSTQAVNTQACSLVGSQDLLKLHDVVFLVRIDQVGHG